MSAAVPLRKRSLSAAAASQRAVRLRGPLPTEDAAEPQGHESWTPRIRLGSKLRATPQFEMQPRPNVGGFWEGTPLFETRSPWPSREYRHLSGRVVIWLVAGPPARQSAPDVSRGTLRIRRGASLPTRPTHRLDVYSRVAAAPPPPLPRRRRPTPRSGSP